MSQDQSNMIPENLSERKSLPFLVSAVSVSAEENNILLRFSNLPSLQRTTGWCLRFINNCRTPLDRKLTSTLSISELNHAFSCWVKITQRIYFGDKLPKPLLSLSPFVDSACVIRVDDKLRNASLSYSAKHPVLLPKHSHLPHILIDIYHKCYLHVGPRTLNSLLCSNFRILSARSVVRQRIRRCLTCFRHQAPALTSMMGNLTFLKNISSRPFIDVGVDFGGSFFRKESSRRTPILLALFICMATREVVSDLSTDAFLAALDRFVSRRGFYRCIYSDNGRIFLGASRYLTEVQRYFHSTPYFEAVINSLSKKGIDWKFIPPATPHFGGLCESGIKSVKYHVMGVIGEQKLTFEEFTTLFCRIEAVLNSPHLCPISSDANKFDVLTPGYFIIGSSLLAIPERDLTDIQRNRLSRWQLLQQFTQSFWSRWRKECLYTLQQRSKWMKDVNNIAEGDPVLMHENNVPSCRSARFSK